jgi:hypothetical protein
MDLVLQDIRVVQYMDLYAVSTIFFHLCTASNYISFCFKSICIASNEICLK